MFLITGCGRSGSTYMTQVLQRCGLEVGHHKMGRDGTVCGFYCFDTDKYPVKSHPVPRPQFDVILHQVRDPLKTVASLQTGRSWKWTCQFLPIGTDAPLLTKCCYNWLVFNEEAERQAVFTYRIEALKRAWPEIQRLLGFQHSYKDAIAGVSRNANARKHGAVTWADVREAAPLIYRDIREATERYGYK